MALISVIIPTAGASGRTSSLLRAIDSVLCQERVEAVPIVVLNGTGFDQALFERLSVRSDLRFFHLKEPGLPGAIQFGRTRVETPFFGFLDDDDHYRPWALEERLEVLQTSPAVDAVVSWGEKEGGQGARQRVPDDAVWQQDDPLAALLRGCWLVSCSGLFRTSSITADFFDPDLRHLEWTSVAIRLALQRTVRFLDSERPHFLIADTPESLSKSSGYLFGMEDALDRIMALPLPPAIRSGFARKKTNIRHTLADHYRIKGDLGQAWRHHLRTFAHAEGLRYLPSTAHFMRSTFERWLFRSAG